jgi:hypothetical protein
MRTQQRPRHYVSPRWLTVLGPTLRYSATRDAYVLRAVGNKTGPVLRPDRRRSRSSYEGAERRQMSAA